MQTSPEQDSWLLHQLPPDLPRPVDDGACAHLVGLAMPPVRLPSTLKRVTLVVRDGTIEHVFYPVFPPDQSAAEVQAWLAAHPLES